MWVFANGPAQASSRLETGNDGDGLCRPRSAVFGREHLHLRPVVRELTATIEADHVDSPVFRAFDLSIVSMRDTGNELCLRLLSEINP